MAWVRSTIAKRSATVGDAYRTLADLLAGNTLLETGMRVPNGLLHAVSNGMTVAYGPQPSDLTNGAGGPIAAGSGISLDSDLEAAWDLGEVWVRNTVALSACTVVLNGPVFIRRGA